MTTFQNYAELIFMQEQKIRSEVSKLTKLHQNRPTEKVKDYEFKNIIRTTYLSELFGGFDELILIHNMGKECPSCTLWADGFNGYYQQMQTRCAFVLISDDSPSEQSQFSQTRGWNFPVYSSQNTDFFSDMGFAKSVNGQIEYLPGVSVFKKTSDLQIERTTSTYFDPHDLYSSIWHLFDLLPSGAKPWEPIRVNKVQGAGLVQINGLNVAIIYTDKINESLKFYSDIFGFENVRSMGKGFLLYHKGAQLTLYIGPDYPSALSLCFNSEIGVLAATEKLKNFGVSISETYGEPSAGFCGIIIKDPSGNPIEIAGAP
jgi:predicted dithiol-disulfide oxidoreductase (DUF899 family)/catechol 2,3-dioxygenase-like lactoylglutathione lyase family enzyme